MLSRRAFLGRAAMGAAAVAGASATLASVLEAATPSSAKPFAITVYKSPTCGCCAKWVEQLKANPAFAVTTRDVDDVAPIKDGVGVPAALRSCHTGLVGGFAFEGHVPPDLMLKVLRERPKIAGLAVPGMPAGSPGMEMGGRKDPFDVVAFTKDGRTSTYAKR